MPDSDTLSVGFDALLAMARLPLTLPLDDGAKLTLNVVLCPALRVRGRLNPLTLKPAPLAVACAIVTLVPPELVSVADWVRLLPI